MTLSLSQRKRLERLEQVFAAGPVDFGDRQAPPLPPDKLRGVLARLIEMGVPDQDTPLGHTLRMLLGEPEESEGQDVEGA